ncbi:metal-dependent hydrolase [Aestuariibius sp. HNIBRBA575]|uniref:metal-dependent hydrolase n=1 Tax=Aestuariibius sp. HNIBRBA575 TaxID=3233343 RepID=UPI0034A574B6
MITAHLPSGYVLGKLLPVSKWGFYAAVLGGILPDFDIIWFYFIDDRAFHHHRYWVHIPAFWGMIMTVVVPTLYLMNRAFLTIALCFFAAIYLHLILDTLSGDILWGWPFSDQFFKFILVPAHYDHWVLNFILHPVFVAEIAIWVIAASLYIRSRNDP